MIDSIHNFKPFPTTSQFGEQEWFISRAVLKLKSPFIEKTISESCTIQRNIVQKDEKEQGERALLNLGHTFGHALETANHYSRNLLHGEAVIIGCCLALELSKKYELINYDQCKRIIQYFKKLNYPTEIPFSDFEIAVFPNRWASFNSQGEDIFFEILLCNSLLIERL